MAAGVGLLAQAGWGRPLCLFGLGACAYTSVNSLGWVLAGADRRPYAVPMLVGAVGSVACAATLLTL